MKLALTGSAAALLFVLVACGSGGNDDVRTFPPGSGTSGTPTRPPSRPTPPPPSDDPSDPPGWGCPQDYPLTDSELDAELGWRPGAPAQGSCSEADLQQIKSNFSDTSVRSYFDLGKGLSDACRACVVSKDTDAKWGPIVGTAENDGETGFVNYGACFGAIEGDACGKAIQYQSFCESLACNDCTVTTKERAECITTATAPGGMCEPFMTKRATSCPSWTLNVKSCGDIHKAIQTLCGAPL